MRTGARPEQRKVNNLVVDAGGVRPPRVPCSGSQTLTALPPAPSRRSQRSESENSRRHCGYERHREPARTERSVDSLRTFRNLCENALREQQQQIAKVAALCEQMIVPAAAAKRPPAQVTASSELSSSSTSEPRVKPADECKTYKIIMRKLDDLNRMLANRGSASANRPGLKKIKVPSRTDTDKMTAESTPMPVVPPTSAILPASTVPQTPCIPPSSSVQPTAEVPSPMSHHHGVPLSSHHPGFLPNHPMFPAHYAEMAQIRRQHRRMLRCHYRDMVSPRSGMPPQSQGAPSSAHPTSTALVVDCTTEPSPEYSPRLSDPTGLNVAAPTYASTTGSTRTSELVMSARAYAERRQQALLQGRRGSGEHLSYTVYKDQSHVPDDTLCGLCRMYLRSLCGCLVLPPRTM